MGLSFAALLAPAAVGQAREQHPSSTGNQVGWSVGLRAFDLRYGRADGKTETVTVAAWYPTEAAPGEFSYGAGGRIQSRVAPDAPLAAAARPCPLVVFAHGLYGCGYNAAYFTEYLASRGYIALAADYIDTAPPDYQQGLAFSRMRQGATGPPGQVVAAAGQFARDMGRDRQALLGYLDEHRLGQTSFLIDEMVRLNRTGGSVWQGAVDEGAIGICGHSLGGLTVLGKLGACPDPSAKDARIKAGLLFSAPGYPFAATVAAVGVPLMIMAGENDEPGLGPQVLRRAIYDGARPPKYYLVLKGATHLSFSTRGCGNLPLDRAVKQVPEMRAICEYGLAFFDRYVRGDAAAGERFRRMDEAWVYYTGEEGPGRSFEWGSEPARGRGRRAVSKPVGGTD